MEKIIIKNAVIITEDPKLGMITRGDILIQDGIIAEVTEKIEGEGQVIDASGMIAVPGFVDGHRHTWESLIRSTGVDWNHAQYFNGVKKVMGPLYTPDDTYVANYLGALECVDAGITTVYDWFHNNNSPEHADAAIQGLKDAGIRAVFGYSDDAEGEIPVSDKPIDYDDVRRIKDKYFTSKNQLLTMAMATRGPQFLEMNHVREEISLARELDIPVCIHVGDGLWGKSRPVIKLKDEGLIDENFTCIHCNTLCDEEIEIIGQIGVDAVFCPEVELNMGHGFPAALRLRAAGIEPGLGIDVCTSIPGDMFGSMRAALMGIRAVVNDHALQNELVVDPLPVLASDVLRFATQNGANACKLGSVTGSITVGKQADITLIQTQALNMFPVTNPVGAVVEAANVGNVDTVLIAGKIVKRNGKLTDVDMNRVRNMVNSARDGLFARAGVPSTGEWVPDVFEGKPRNE